MTKEVYVIHESGRLVVHASLCLASKMNFEQDIATLLKDKSLLAISLLVSDGRIALMVSMEIQLKWPSEPISMV